MKDKLKLTDLNVKSFNTKFEAKNIQGGAVAALSEPRTICCHTISSPNCCREEGLG